MYSIGLWLISEPSFASILLAAVTVTVSMLFSIVLPVEFYRAANWRCWSFVIILCIAAQTGVYAIFLGVPDWSASFNHAQFAAFSATIVLILLALIYLHFPHDGILPPVGLCVANDWKVGLVMQKYFLPRGIPSGTWLDFEEDFVWNDANRLVWRQLRQGWLGCCLRRLAWMFPKRGGRGDSIVRVAWDDCSTTLETAWSAMLCLRTISASRKNVHDIILMHLRDDHRRVDLNMIPKADPMFFQGRELLAELIKFKTWGNIGPMLKGKVLPDGLKTLFLSADYGLMPLRYAGEQFRSDLSFMIQLVEKNPNAIVFAGKRLRRNAPEFTALLEKANLRSDHLVEGGEEVKAKVMVMSVRYSLAENASTAANDVLLPIREFQEATEPSSYDDFAVYTPNEFSKGFCGGGSYWWKYKRYITDPRCRCRGQRDGPLRCHKFADYVNSSTWPPGMPLSEEVCWRYSFRWHLERAHWTGGCMLQVAEITGLGAGQKIEEDMARDVGIPIVRLELPEYYRKEDLRDLVRDAHIA